jgi:hypothetical protein
MSTDQESIQQSNHILWISQKPSGAVVIVFRLLPLQWRVTTITKPRPRSPYDEQNHRRLY